MPQYRIPELDLSTRCMLGLEMLGPIPERAWGRATELAQTIIPETTSKKQHSLTALKCLYTNTVLLVYYLCIRQDRTQVRCDVQQSQP
jgi:hypothetical protein